MKPALTPGHAYYDDYNEIQTVWYQATRYASRNYNVSLVPCWPRKYTISGFLAHVIIILFRKFIACNIHKLTLTIINIRIT